MGDDPKKGDGEGASNPPEDRTNKFDKMLVDATKLTFEHMSGHLVKAAASIKHLKEAEVRGDELNTRLNFYTYVLSSKDVFYETSFVYLSVFAILKLDSFSSMKESVMVTFIHLLLDIAKNCSLIRTTIGKDTIAVPFLSTVDKLFQKVAWILG